MDGFYKFNDADSETVPVVFFQEAPVTFHLYRGCFVRDDYFLDIIIIVKCIDFQSRFSGIVFERTYFRSDNTGTE